LRAPHDDRHLEVERVMRLREALLRIGYRWRTRGLRGVLSLVRDNLYWTQKLRRFRVDLDAWRPSVSPPESLAVRAGLLPELISMRSHGRRLPAEFHVDELHDARAFYVGMWNGELAHISWVFTHESRNELLRLQRGEVEIRYSYTLPAFRGRRVYRSAIEQILAELQRGGTRVVYAHVAHDNAPPLRALVACGFSAVEDVVWWRCLGMRGVRRVRREIDAEKRPA
jgi:hypothetical protein